MVSGHEINFLVNWPSHTAFSCRLSRMHGVIRWARCARGRGLSTLLSIQHERVGVCFVDDGVANNSSTRSRRQRRFMPREKKRKISFAAGTQKPFGGGGEKERSSFHVSKEARE